MKIMLDAGHFGNTYNPGAMPMYYESNMTWDLHLLLKAELEKRGFEVGTTRDDKQKDLDEYLRGEKARGYDLLLSLHSNAFISGEKVQRVVVIHPISNRSKTLADKLAKAVHETMDLSGKQPYQLYQKILSGSNVDSYKIIRGAVAVGSQGIIIEHSFHTNKEACTWLMTAGNLQKLAVAEAETLAAHFGVSTEPLPQPEPPTPPVISAKSKLITLRNDLEKIIAEME